MPRLNSGPISRASAARTSPRISEPRLSSKPSERARIRLASPTGPIAMSSSETEGTGRTRTEIGPATRTFRPARRLASASKNAR